MLDYQMVNSANALIEPCGGIAPPQVRFCALGTRCCVYFASCLSMKSAMMWVASMDSGRDASYQKA